MSDVAQEVYRFAKYSTRTDVSSTPGSLLPFDWMEGTDIDHDVAVIPRNVRRGDGERVPGIAGQRRTNVVLKGELSGLNSPSATGVVDADAQTEMNPLLEMIYGSDVINGGHASGVETTTGSTPASAELEVDTGHGARLAVGQGILFDGIAREIVSIASDTITVDRAFPADPGAGVDVFPAATLALNPRVKDPFHGYVTKELAYNNAGSARLARRDAYGVALRRMVMELPLEGGPCTRMFEGEGTDWGRPSVDNPSYAAPTKGSVIPFVQGYFYIGDTVLDVKSLSYEVVRNIVKRQAPGGANGYRGFYDRGDPMAKLSGELYFGELATEVPDGSGTPDLQDLEGGAVRDCALQIGTEPGACWYLRFPALHFNEVKLVPGERRMIRFSGIDTRSPNHANVVGGVREHTF